jgi:nucleotide-binding universal stress UspA family protein
VIDTYRSLQTLRISPPCRCSKRWGQNTGYGASSEIQLLGGAGASSISIMINDVMRVLNFSLAFVISADMIFAGGYGHSRLPEAPMGGATRTLLGSMTAPVLMTH